MKLPLRIENVNLHGYDIKDSTDELVSFEAKWESLAFSLDEAKEVVQAANNFPEAVRLLKELLKEISYGDIIEEVNQFLIKLEEDEKDSK